MGHLNFRSFLLECKKTSGLLLNLVDLVTQNRKVVMLLTQMASFPLAELPNFSPKKFPNTYYKINNNSVKSLNLQSGWFAVASVCVWRCDQPDKSRGKRVKNRNFSCTYVKLFCRENAPGILEKSLFRPTINKHSITRLLICK